MNEREEGIKLEIDFSKLKQIAGIEENVIPVAVQHAETGEMLIVAYANQAALDYSLKNNVAAFWSTSRNELWVKGATSGDTLTMVDVRVNCEQNSLLYRVIPKNTNSCHTHRTTCYYRNIINGQLEFVASN